MDKVYKMLKCGKIDQWQIREVPIDEVSSDNPRPGKPICTCYGYAAASGILNLICNHPDEFKNPPKRSLAL